MYLRYRENSMRDYKKLGIWKKAHLFVLQIYNEILRYMTNNERFALSQQIRRTTYAFPLMKIYIHW